MRSVFDSLGRTDEQHPLVQKGTHLFEQAAAMMRGHHADDDVGAPQGLVEFVCYQHRFRNWLTGKEEIILATATNRIAHLAFQGPEPNLMNALASRYDRE